MAKVSVSLGQGGELVTRSSLTRLGFEMIERVHTPWRIQRKGKKIVGATPVERVSGDFIAIEPGTGKKVLVESKLRKGDRIRWSDLEKHQIEALDNNHALGGISLVSMTCDYGHCILRWPIEGFEPGKSLIWNRVIHIAL